MRNCMMVVIVAVAAFYCPNVQALVMETMPVGNAGNAPDSTGYGAVSYEYSIGKFEVTAGQYAEFLNAVAAIDPYGLYNTYMDYDANFGRREEIPSDNGCNIKRAGIPGEYTYSVDSEWANRPVNYVSWGDAARFCNWMHNGQGGGDTENGSYNLDGAVTVAELAIVTRESDATWVIPSENEWYKAAYHKNNGVTSEFFGYPTSSDNVPSNDIDGGGNNATFWDGDYTVDSPYYRTEIGAHTNSASPYGTFDQGGNVWEWNETTIDTAGGIRGGSSHRDSACLYSAVRGICKRTMEIDDIGFRLTYVPEPATLTLLALGGLVVLRRR